MNACIFTFHKCGSNWFRPIFRSLAKTVQGSYIPHASNTVGINEKMYFGDGYVINLFHDGKKKVVDEFLFNEARDNQLVFCIRDPRDALVSQYFSWRNSHKNNNSKILRYRDKFQNMSPVEGMKLILDNDDLIYLNYLSPWLEYIDKEKPFLFRYEELSKSFESHFMEMLCFINIEITLDQISSIYKENHFESKTNRKIGEENQKSHLRKGVAGDYMNHFDDTLYHCFNKKYGHILDFLGYEK